jgi:hypothetical protein
MVLFLQAPSEVIVNQAGPFLESMNYDFSAPFICCSFVTSTGMFAVRAASLMMTF